jgi:hypothetical protein
MTNPNIPPSDEGARHSGDEFIIAEDWDIQFTANAAAMRALSVEIAATEDPDKLLGLTEMKGEALVRTLGSGALSLSKRDVVAERGGFEAEFGDR